jgi:hypothetical protein
MFTSRKLGLALACLVLLFLVAPVRAGDDDKYFTAFGHVDFTDSIPTKNGVHVTITIDGNGCPLDDFTGEGSFDLSANGDAITNGIVTLQTSAEDSLTLVYEASIDPENGAMAGSFLIVDGTGLYEGAMGEGTLTGVTDGTTSADWILDGSMKPPG